MIVRGFSLKRCPWVLLMPARHTTSTMKDVSFDQVKLKAGSSNKQPLFQQKMATSQRFWLPKTHIFFAPENRLFGPIRSIPRKYSNHPFSGVMLVSGRVYMYIYIHIVILYSMANYRFVYCTCWIEDVQVYGDE